MRFNLAAQLRVKTHPKSLWLMKRFIGPSPRAKKKEVNGADRDPIRTWLAGAIRLHGSFTPSVEGQALGGQSVTSLLFRPFVGPSV